MNRNLFLRKIVLHADKQRDTCPLIFTQHCFGPNWMSPLCHSSTGFATATALLPVQSVFSLYLQGN